MGHCACIALTFEDEDVLNDGCGRGYDYFTTFEEDTDTINWYRGLTLKDGIENEYMYIARDGNKYAYKAKTEDIDLDKTIETCDFYMFVDYRMTIDKMDLAETKFFDFFRKRFENATDIEIVDVHF